jgi:uncharacterized membrane protein HdeD (DUF308 family)
MKVKPRESAMLLRLGIVSVLLGIVAAAVSPFSPSPLFPAFFGVGTFMLGLGVGCLIFSVRMGRIEKQNPPPPPPPP